MGESREMNKNKEKYITIGTLAKLTNVHVKSLRYYDKIGILPPVYVNPETGYRYYSQQQVILVDAIQLCVELDIPLKHFQTFLADNKTQILFSRLLEYGTSLANAKIKAINKKLERLEDMQREIYRGESLPQDGMPVICRMPSKLCWVVPFQGEWGTSAFYALANNLYLEIKATDWKIGYETGIMTVYSRNAKSQKQYIFVEVSGKDGGNLPYLFELPGGNYLCSRRQQHGIGDAPQLFPELFHEEYDKIVVEVELYAGDYHLLHPEFELRCSMP